MKGKGIDTLKERGDLIVTVNVEVPTELSDAERLAVEQLRAATTLEASTVSSEAPSDA